VSEALLTDDFRIFLERHLPKIKGRKKPKFNLGILQLKLGSLILKVLRRTWHSNDFVFEHLRGKGALSYAFWQQNFMGPFRRTQKLEEKEH
jgi:hypothetical protein